MSSKDPLGSRMKEYEARDYQYLDPLTPFVVRLDGCSFHNYTKGMQKPFDLRLHRALVQTCEDLLNKFTDCRLVYTQSDEISMVFSSALRMHQETAMSKNKQGATSTAADQVPTAAPSRDELVSQLVYGGRVQKIVSVTSAFCSARFNFHIAKESWDPEKEPKVHERVMGANAIFDARCFNLPDDNEVLNNILWRSVHDCKRNSKMMLAQCHFDHKILHGVPADEAIKMLKEQKGIDWHDYPSFFRFGTFTKKEKVMGTGWDPKSDEEVAMERRKISSKSFDLGGFSEANLALMQCKHWNDVRGPWDEAV